MRKTVIYLRTSTEEQDPENQKEACMELFKKFERDPGLPEIYIERQSAWKDTKERPKFELLRKEIAKSKIGRLIVWDLDRIYRNRKNLISFFSLCKEFKVRVESYRQQWLNNLQEIQEPFNEIMFDLMLQIMGWLAEEESSKKSQRIKAAAEKRGDKTYSRFGKKWGRKAIPDHVREKVRALHKSGESIRKISRNPEVYYWDGQNNKQKLSRGTVHKIIKENSPRSES